VERYLRDIEAWCWEYRENTRNYPGIHFTARPADCDALLRCLDVLVEEGEGATRLASLNPLASEDEARISGGQRYHCFSQLRLRLAPQTDALQQMYVAAQDEKTVHIEITCVRLECLRRGIEDIKRGTGDYSMGPRSDKRKGYLLGSWDRRSKPFWFWPCFGHLWPAD
jgi:hypothetical protein